MSVDTPPVTGYSPEAAPAQFEPVNLELETPFAETHVFSREQPGRQEPSPSLPSFDTPFTSAYFGEVPAERERSAFAEMLAELADPEFGEALAELVQEAAAQYGDHASRLGDSESETAVADRAVGEWLDSLRSDAEALLESMAQAAAHADPATLTEDEVDRLFEALEPQGPFEAPVFEGLLNGIFKMAKRAAKKAVDVARKGIAAVSRVLPIGQILAKLKQLVRPLLERVLRFATDRLPASLRPAAMTLARRLTGEVSPEGGLNELTGEEPATPDPAVLQREFDIQVASLLLATDETDQQLVLNEALVEAAQEEPSGVSELDRARAVFVSRLTAMEPGEDPRPALEEFVPAVMALLKGAVAIIGRPRLVNFLTDLLMKVIGRFVGPNRALAQAIVDTGLRMISLETPTDREYPVLAANAVAGLVEDTVRGVAQLSEEALDDPARLEAAAMEAVNEAAARNIPPSLLRPDLPQLEASTGGGTWVARPLRRRQRYRRYTKAFEVTITPQIARAVRTFGGGTLESVLRDRLQVTLPVRARVHLFEAMPGGWLARIARLDPAPGLRDKAQFQPLTPEAAALLLRQPALCKQVDARFLAGPHAVAVGQRFYYLQIPGPLPPAGTSEPSDLRVTFDVRPGRDEIRVHVRLSEREAQLIAARLNARQVPAALGLFQRAVTPLLAPLRTGTPGRQVHVISDTAPVAQPPAGWTPGGWPGGPAAGLVTGRLAEHLWAAMSGYFTTRAEEFLAATRDPQSGVTVTVTMAGSPLLAVVRSTLAGQAPAPQAVTTLLQSGAPAATVSTRPGRRHA